MKQLMLKSLPKHPRWKRFYGVAIQAFQRVIQIQIHLYTHSKHDFTQNNPFAMGCNGKHLHEVFQCR